MKKGKQIATKIIAMFMTSIMLLISTSILIPLSAFAQTHGEVASTQSDVEYESTNTLGSMLLEYSEQQQEGAGSYQIQSVEIDETTATVEIMNLNACSLLVAVYNNDGTEMLGSGKISIESKSIAEYETVSVEIIIDEMPQYFYIKAFLLDENYAPLCENYTSYEYTKEYEEYLAKKAEDFEPDLVINLDESVDNNFLVVSEEATVIESVNGKNIVATDDYENGIYVITSADDTVKGLQEGELFYYQYGESENDYIIAKAGSIDINGDTVIITADDDTELSELFQYAKVDVDSSNTTFDGTEMDEDVTHETVTPMATRSMTDVTYSVSDKWTATKQFSNGTELKFSIGAQFEFSLKLIIDVQLWGKDYVYLNTVLGYNAKFDVSLSGKLPEVKVPMGKIGLDADFAKELGITAKVALNFIVEAEAALELTVTFMNAAVGFSYEAGAGFKDQSRSPSTSLDPSMKVEVKIFVGLSIAPELKVTKHVRAKWESKIGTDIGCSLPITNRHLCSVCFAITVDFVASSEFNITIFGWIENTVELGNLTRHLGNFYWSADIGFGRGNCPNTTSGSCGNNLTWILNENGELIISGTGAMADYNSTNMPWYLCRSSITSVTISNGVTSIGGYAFYGCSNMKTMTIPATVTSIKNWSFYGSGIEYIFFGGTQEDWEAIPMTSYGDYLSRAIVYYNCNTAQFAIVDYVDDIMSVYVDEDLVNVSEGITIETIPNAIIGYSYIMAIVKDETAEDLLGSENLIFIDQEVATLDSLDFEFALDETVTDYRALFFESDFSHSHDYAVIAEESATCTAKGEKTYACFCGESYTETFEMLAHTEISVPQQSATCIKNGYTEGMFCSECKQWVSGHEEISATGEHSFKNYISNNDATCTLDGTKTSACDNCMETNTITDIESAKGHNDMNGDGICDNGGEIIEVEDENPSENCSHLCHKSGFMNFIWKIIRFFFKLFKINSVCDCGIAHY